MTDGMSSTLAALDVLQLATGSGLTAEATLPRPNLFGESPSTLSARSASVSAAAISDIVNSLDQLQGTATLANGILTAALTGPTGPIDEIINLPSLATDFADFFQQVSGSLDLNGGTAAGTLAIADEQFQGSLNFADLAGNLVSDFLTGLDGTVSFADGQIPIDVSTFLGNVTGTLGFANGAFTSALTTPVGPLNFSVPFPADAQIPFELTGTEGGVLDLAGGEIAIDVISALAGPEIVIPLSDLAGSFTFADGTVTASVGLPDVDLPFIDLPTLGTTLSFDFAEPLGTFITSALTGVTGTLTVGDGSLGSNLVTPLGTFAGTLDLTQLVNNLVAEVSQYAGTLTFANGQVVSNLTTPTGSVVEETIDLAQVKGYLSSVIGLFA